MRKGWHWLGVVVLLLAGCRTPMPDIKPPPQPDDFTLPPEEKRYSQPYEYSKDPNDPSLAPSRRNSGATPGAPGMSGGGPRGGPASYGNPGAMMPGR